MIDVVTQSETPLVRRVERQVPKLARAMLERFVTEIPLYGLLPREQLEGEILAVTDHNLRMFFAMLRDGRSLRKDELQHVIDSAAKRAEERVPLDAVLAAYHLGCRVGWEALTTESQPGEETVMLEFVPSILTYVQQVTAAVSSAYLDEQQSIYGEERDARRSLVNAMLLGEAGEEIAARIGMTLATEWVVVELRIAEHVDEAERRVGGAVAGRRKLARLMVALDAWAGEAVLSRLDPSGGSVLLPVTIVGDGDPSAHLAGMTKDLATAAQAQVTTSWALAHGIGDVPRAAAQAADVLALVRDLGKPQGAYALKDVLLEYQLTRPSDAQSVLSRLLDPIDRNPDLQRTLEHYLACDLDRRRTAASLHVHPNTLDYRLRRIVDLTGLDPASARGLQLLGAALAARRLGR